MRLESLSSTVHYSKPFNLSRLSTAPLLDYFDRCYALVAPRALLEGKFKQFFAMSNKMSHSLIIFSMLLYFVISVTVPAAASDVALIALQALQNPLALPFVLLLSLLFSLSLSMCSHAVLCRIMLMLMWLFI